MAQRIYFDESGFTGNNLLHPNQEIFAYASIATDDQEAADTVSKLVEKYGIQGGELKGKNLIKFSKGRKAIDEIFEEFEGRIKLSVSNKKFALACKFHEYIFEPCYSSISSLFYGTGFHLFIANILYVEFRARGAGAEQIFGEFETLMRGQELDKLESIFASSVHKDNSPVLLQIREFAQLNAEAIKDELEGLKGTGTGKWILDLTNTALASLLASWGQEHDQLTAICDPSKPLREDQSFFNAMIGNKNRLFSDMFGEHHPVTFNLSGPLEFRDSKVTHGIQLADAIAAAGVHVFSGATDDHAKRWREILPAFSAHGSIIPDLDELDLNSLRTQRNVLLLSELHARALENKSLTDGMAEYVDMISARLQFDPIFAVST
jgi:hypothetical protein